MEWSTACPDWEQRLIDHKWIIPSPIFIEEAERTLQIFRGAARSRSAGQAKDGRMLR